MSNEFVEKYVIEEMKVARDRINAEIAVMNQYEILVIGLIGAIYAVILQYRISDRTALFILTSLPAVVAVYGYFRYRVHAKVIIKHNSYLKKLEKFVKARDKDFEGLATFWDTESSRTYIGTIRTYFWFFIIAIAAALMFLTHFYPDLLAGSVHPKDTVSSN